MVMEMFTDKALEGMPLQKFGIVLQRDADNTVSTNVPHLATHHSPTGFEYGYMGSGPADLALNIVEAVLKAEQYTGTRSAPLWDGRTVFQASYRIHQVFKSVFIAPLSREVETHIIPYERVKTWIIERVREYAQEFEPEDSAPPDMSDFY